MSSFFWRIFLSAWSVLFITLALTGAIAYLIPTPFDGEEKGKISARVGALIARDLRRELAVNPAVNFAELVAQYDLDLAPIQTIYVLGPDGRDLQGRPLPKEVAALTSAGGDPVAAARSISRRLYVEHEDLAGHKVVGLMGFFPLGNGVMKPGVRALLPLIALLVSVTIASLLAGFIARPVRQLRLAGQRVASGDLTVRVAPTVGNRSDDIAKLARDFDIMTEQVDALLQSRHRLLRDVSHELRSPLARLQALLSIQRQSANSSDMPRIDRMERELERLDVLIGEILHYSRLEATDTVNRHATDLVDLIQTIVDDAELEVETQGKALALKVPKSYVVRVDSNLIHRAVENVVRNALKFTGDDSTVTVALRIENQDVVIAVADRGPGVPEDQLDQIFEPFFRIGDGRNTQSGSGGIGLAIAQRSLRLHGGSARAMNREGGGLCVELRMPVGDVLRLNSVEDESD